MQNKYDSKPVMSTKSSKVLVFTLLNGIGPAYHPPNSIQLNSIR